MIMPDQTQYCNVFLEKFDVGIAVEMLLRQNGTMPRTDCGDLDEETPLG